MADYLDGELPLDERDALEGHLESCADCRELAGHFRSIDSLASRTTPPAVSGREWAAILENVTREDRVIELPSRHRTWEWMLPAAAVAALVVLGVFLGRGLLTDDGELPAQTRTPGAHSASTTEPEGFPIKGPRQDEVEKTDNADGSDRLDRGRTPRDDE